MATFSGTDIDETFTGGSGSDTITGAGGNDVLDGAGGNDRISGGDGDDTIYDTVGTLSIDGGSGNDYISVGNLLARTGTIAGGLGTDTLSAYGNISGVAISGIEVLETAYQNVTASAAQLQSLSSIVVYSDPSFVNSDVVLTLAGAGAVDLTTQLEGLRGATVYASVSGNTITTGIRSDNLYGNNSIDILSAGGGDDYIAGGNGNDILTGGSGNDTITGEIGNDQISGGDDDDTIYDTVGTLSIDGGSGNDYISVGNLSARTGTIAGGLGTDTLSAYGNISGVTIAGIEVLETAYQNVTTSAAQLQSLSSIVVYSDPSYVNSDVVLTLAGAGAVDLTTQLEGLRGATVYASVSGNTITTGIRSDNLYGNNSIDILSAGGGDDYIAGGNGNDILTGGSGNDTITGEIGNDQISGGDDDDTIYDTVGTLSIDGGSGNDYISVGNLSARTGTIAGGLGTDTLSAYGNISGVTIAGIEVLETAYQNVTASAAQLQSLSSIVVYSDPSYVNSDVVLTLAGAGAVDLTTQLEGKRGATVYASTAGNDITGGAKDDALYGASGNDTLAGGVGNDIIDSSLGNDRISGGDGNDNISDFSGTLWIDGGDGNDFVSVGNVEGRSGTIGGGGGIDVLNAYGDLSGVTISGIEVLETGYQNITATAAQLSSFLRIATYADASYATADVILTLAGGGTVNIADQLEGKRAATVYASAAGNFIATGSKDDYLYGDTGNDTFNGGAGNDHIDGGSGTDLAVFSGNYALYSLNTDGTTTTIVGEGNDILTNVDYAVFNDGTYDFSTKTFTFDTVGKTVNGTGIGESLAGGGGDDVINGLGGNDTLVGGNGDDILDGGTGADLMIGGKGSDIYYVDDAGDIVTEAAGEGIDTVHTTLHNYTLAANVENLVIDGTADINVFGNDLDNIIVGNSGRNVIFAGAGNDTIYSNGGISWLDGGTGADTYYGGNGDDGYVFDNAGDTVLGEVDQGGKDAIWSSINANLSKYDFVENLRLTGVDNIDGSGNGLANIITGTSGNNVIAGLGGRDSLYGKGGADIFDFAEFGSVNQDAIWDFDNNDKIQLHSSVFTGLASSGGHLDATDYLLNSVAKITGEAVVIYNAGDGILYYDSDGKGGGAAEAISFIGKKLAFFDYSDIQLV